MAKTTAQEIDDKLEALQLELIDENSAIDALMPKTEQEFNNYNPTLDHDRRVHEGKRAAIKEKIAFLTARRAQLSLAARRSQRPKTTKQAQVYGEIVKMKTKGPKLTNKKAFEVLAPKLGSSEEAIRKAFYAEQKRLNDEASGSAKGKRDSESNSDEQRKGNK